MDSFINDFMKRRAVMIKNVAKICKMALYPVCVEPSHLGSSQATRNYQQLLPSLSFHMYRD
jgi:hypothetical protein